MTPHVSTTLLRTQSDERLVKLTAAGHDRAFEAIVDRYRRPLLRYARRFLSEGRAEDVVQAAFVSAWGALRNDVAVRDLRPWLYRIVHNGALNAMKRPGGDDAPLLETGASGPGPELEVECRDDVRRILGDIAQLPERQRAALLAVAVDGRAHADVAAELGLSDTAVRQLVRRARVSLRAAATALTPWPAAAWLAQLGSAGGAEVGGRIAESAAAGGLAGTGIAGLAGGAAVKTGAIVATVGAIAAGAPTVVHTTHHRESSAAKAATPRSSNVSRAATVGSQPAAADSTTRVVSVRPALAQLHLRALPRTAGASNGTPSPAPVARRTPVAHSTPAPVAEHPVVRRDSSGSSHETAPQTAPAPRDGRHQRGRETGVPDVPEHSGSGEHASTPETSSTTVSSHSGSDSETEAPDAPETSTEQHRTRSNSGPGSSILEGTRAEDPQPSPTAPAADTSTPQPDGAPH